MRPMFPLFSLNCIMFSAAPGRAKKNKYFIKFKIGYGEYIHQDVGVLLNSFLKFLVWIHIPSY
jgi:hypothetical protein